MKSDISSLVLKQRSTSSSPWEGMAIGGPDSDSPEMRGDGVASADGLRGMGDGTPGPLETQIWHVLVFAPHPSGILCAHKNSTTFSSITLSGS